MTATTSTTAAPPTPAPSKPARPQAQGNEPADGFALLLQGRLLGAHGEAGTAAPDAAPSEEIAPDDIDAQAPAGCEHAQEAPARPPEAATDDEQPIDPMIAWALSGVHAGTQDEPADEPASTSSAVRDVRKGPAAGLTATMAATPESGAATKATADDAGSTAVQMASAGRAKRPMAPVSSIAATTAAAGKVDPAGAASGSTASLVDHALAQASVRQDASATPPGAGERLASLWSAMTDERPGAQSARVDLAGAERPAGYAAVASHTATPAGTSAAATTVQGHLAPPAGSPGFAPALAHQLTTWARQGVHNAELTLHPAELGTVSVRIALDGHAAKVEFAAATAHGREALQAALPSLAGLFSAAGLTLAGADVHTRPSFGDGGQARQDNPGGRQPSGDPSSAGVPDDGAPMPASSARRALGRLDLYA